MAEYKKEDNSERMKYQKQIQERLEMVEQRQNKWYAKPYAVYRFLIEKPLAIVRYLMGVLVNLTWRIERWLP